MKNKVLTAVLIIFSAAALCSCGSGWEELKPVSNEKNLRIKLEITEEGGSGENGAFALRITNESDSDFVQCSFRFDDKYEHKFEGLADKTGDAVIPLTRSLIKTRETFVFYFNDKIDNYARFGLKEQIKDGKKNYIPSTIEFNCHVGTIVWKVPEKL
ncbi:MAG: hypothetical protein MUE56_02130 [Ignavibacteria bacterium]|jgi:hypothetical protein|nr:hypothetical protein [Ignavibacteria bacterium]